MNNNLKEFIDTHRFSLIIVPAVVGVLYFLKRYFNGAFYNDKNAKLNGKTVIITGSNTGIGKETALDLARRGARVILACRDAKRGEEAAEHVRKTTGNGNVLFESLDLASLESVKNFADKINKNEERLDILINNAGKFKIKTTLLSILNLILLKE